MTVKPTIFLLALLPAAALAQTPTRHITVLDVALGDGFLIDPHYSGAVSAWRMWGPQPSPETGGPSRSILGRFTYGVGLRATHFNARHAYEYAGRGDAEGQSLNVDGSPLTALNAAGQVRFRLLGRADSKHPLNLGFNIDLAGVTFGSSSRATRLAANGQLTVAQINPVRANLLLGNTNDRGTLNSELYLSLRVAPRLTARFAFAHIATSYAFSGGRYQKFFDLAVLGFSYGIGDAGRSY